MASRSTFPSFEQSMLNAILNVIGGDNLPSPASPIHLPAEVLTAICVALQHIRAYRTLATLMRVSFDLYIIAGPKLYQRLTLDKKGIQALLGPLGMLKGDLPGKTGIAAGWQELGFYPIGQDIEHQTLPPLWHLDWESAKSYSLNPPATLARDSVRRRLALLARTQDIAWHYTSLRLRGIPESDFFPPVFRSATHLSLNYDTVREFPIYAGDEVESRRATALCSDIRFPASLMRDGYDICIDYCSSYIDEDELGEGFASECRSQYEGIMCESIRAITRGGPTNLSFRYIDGRLPLVVIPGAVHRYYLPGRRLETVTGPHDRKILTDGRVDHIFGALSKPGAARALRLEFINVGTIIIRPGHSFNIEAHFHGLIEQEVINGVRKGDRVFRIGSTWRRSSHSRRAVKRAVWIVMAGVMILAVGEMVRKKLGAIITVDELR